MNSDFDAFLDQAWADHADDAEGVAARIAAQGLGLVQQAAQVAPLAQLAHHVWGAHLGDGAAGSAWLQQLAGHAAADEAGLATVRRCQASLALGAGQAQVLDGLPGSERCRVAAMAASNLVDLDRGRAAALFEQALAEAEAAALAADDPAHRALAIAANNLACALEELPQRSPAERAQMLRAAQASRVHWALAGTWLETERAEYRLAMSWLKAGDPAQALPHAQACLDIVQAHAGPALECFYAWQALGLVARAAGDPFARLRALARAHQAFAQLTEADRLACRPGLDAMID